MDVTWIGMGADGCHVGALLQVVVAPPELHWQSLASPAYDGSLCGEVRSPEGHLQPLPLDGRRVIAHRAMLAISRPNAVINLGVGMPEVRRCSMQHTAERHPDSIMSRATPHWVGHASAAKLGDREEQLHGGPALACMPLLQALLPATCDLARAAHEALLPQWQRLHCTSLAHMPDCTDHSSGAVTWLQGVAVAVATHARQQNAACLPLTLTTEVGIVGGFPAGGLRFGAAHNAVAAMPCASMLDFYNGCGADVACLGMAEVTHLLPPQAAAHLCGCDMRVHMCMQLHNGRWRRCLVLSLQAPEQAL